jgi:hypothetical protein
MTPSKDVLILPLKALPSDAYYKLYPKNKGDLILNELQFTSAITQSKNLEISISMFVGECYHYTNKDSNKVAVKLATVLLSHVIPLQYLVNLIYINQDVDYYNEVPKQIFRHLNLLDDALEDVANEGYFIHNEMNHVLNQFMYTRHLLSDLLGNDKKRESEIDDSVGLSQIKITAS